MKLNSQSIALRANKRVLFPIGPLFAFSDQRRPGPGPAGFGQQSGGPPPAFEAPPRFGDFNNGPPPPFNRGGQGSEFNDNFQQSPFRGGPRGGPGGWRGGRGGGRGNFREGKNGLTKLQFLVQKSQFEDH